MLFHYDGLIFVVENNPEKMKKCSQTSNRHGDVVEHDEGFCNGDERDMEKPER